MRKTANLFTASILLTAIQIHIFHVQQDWIFLFSGIFLYPIYDRFSVKNKARICYLLDGIEWSAVSVGIIYLLYSLCNSHNSDLQGIGFVLSILTFILVGQLIKQQLTNLFTKIDE